jgi:hypothetical protein
MSFFLNAADLDGDLQKGKQRFYALKIGNASSALALRAEIVL